MCFFCAFLSSSTVFDLVFQLQGCTRRCQSVSYGIFSLLVYMLVHIFVFAYAHMHHVCSLIFYQTIDSSWILVGAAAFLFLA